MDFVSHVTGDDIGRASPIVGKSWPLVHFTPNRVFDAFNPNGRGSTINMTNPKS
jgi:hypothetical protein